jgi:hypothetical protein
MLATLIFKYMANPNRRDDEQDSSAGIIGPTNLNGYDQYVSSSLDLSYDDSYDEDFTHEVELDDLGEPNDYVVNQRSTKSSKNLEKKQAKIAEKGIIIRDLSKIQQDITLEVQRLQSDKQRIYDKSRVYSERKTTLMHRTSMINKEVNTRLKEVEDLECVVLSKKLQAIWEGENDEDNNVIINLTQKSQLLKVEAQALRNTMIELKTAYHEADDEYKKLNLEVAAMVSKIEERELVIRDLKLKINMAQKEIGLIRREVTVLNAEKEYLSVEEGGDGKELRLLTLEYTVLVKRNLLENIHEINYIFRNVDNKWHKIQRTGTTKRVKDSKQQWLTDLFNNHCKNNEAIN